MPELNKHIIAFLKAAQDGIPAVFVDETFRASSRSPRGSELPPSPVRYFDKYIPQPRSGFSSNGLFAMVLSPTRKTVTFLSGSKKAKPLKYHCQYDEGPFQFHVACSTTVAVILIGLCPPGPCPA